MAKLHSLVDENSSICLVDIIEKAISIHFSEVSGSSVIGVILPSTFIAGGKLVVIKRSEPLYLFIWRSQVNNSSFALGGLVIMILDNFGGYFIEMDYIK